MLRTDTAEISSAVNLPQIAVVCKGHNRPKSGKGEVRISALKQYGLLKGDTKTGFFADDLAKKIAAAPDDELVPLYHQAILKPTIFKRLFDTYHGDSVTKAKLKQRASDLKVHLDETETCIDLYISGMQLAALVTIESDRVKHIASSELSNVQKPTEVLSDLNQEIRSNTLSHEDEATTLSDPADSSEVDDALGGAGPSLITSTSTRKTDGPRAVFNVTVTLDSSLDTEKLQKQLELLKRFGAI